jgi:hypothetical protein
MSFRRKKKLKVFGNALTGINLSLNILVSFLTLMGDLMIQRQDKLRGAPLIGGQKKIITSVRVNEGDFLYFQKNGIELSQFVRDSMKEKIEEEMFVKGSLKGDVFVR